MAATPRITGVGTVNRNLARAGARIQRGVAAGVYAAALQVKAEAMRRTPKETGNLQQSAYARMVGGTTTTINPIAEVGYTAAYAPYVHEIPPPPEKSVPGGRSATHTIGRWKFLESAMTDLRGTIKATILRFARLAR
jgi:hypothetical protein